MNNKAAILVVDDKRGVRQSFNMVLKNEYHVLLAGTGEKAIDIFQKNHIDLILLDILLPGINGIDLLKKFVAVHGLKLEIGNSGDLSAPACALHADRQFLFS